MCLLVCDYLLRCCLGCEDSPARPRPINPRAITKGTVNQSDVQGKYAGIQCTSVCLAALVWWYFEGEQGSFNPESIDASLYYGTELHRYLREDLKVSNDKDKRVSIEDLPDQLILEDGSVVKRDRRSEKFALLYVEDPKEDSLNIVMLKDYLTECGNDPFGVLLTVGEYTHAVFYTNTQKWLVFDSHGDLAFKWRRRLHQATVWEFETVDAVVAFFAEIHRGESYCQVVKPQLEAVTNVEPMNVGNDDDMLLVVTPDDDLHSVNTFSYPAGDDDEGYVSFMGGFGYDD